MANFIMDLEWNTPRKVEQENVLNHFGFPFQKKWPSIEELSPFDEQKRVPMRYEIIEFAAIPTDAPLYQREVYKALVSPMVYSELQSRIIGLTGHTLEKLKLRGKSFGKVWHNFCRFHQVQEAPTFLIWSFSDAEILFENLCFFENKSSFSYEDIRFVDLQYLFSRYTYHFSRPLSLQRALEILGLYVPNRLHTAEIDTFSTRKVYDGMAERLGRTTLERIVEHHALSYKDIKELDGFSYVHKAQEFSLQRHAAEYRFSKLVELIEAQKRTEVYLDSYYSENPPLEPVSEEDLSSEDVSVQELASASAEEVFFEYLRKQKQYLRLTTRHLEEKEKTKLAQKAKQALLREGYRFTAKRKKQA